MDNKPNATEADIEAGQAAMHGAMQSELTQRDLPAWAIRGVECECGNTAITQWLNQGAKLTILEEIQAERLAA